MPETTIPRGLPFEGMFVLELADDPAGEYAGKLFADLGADVLKVEPPEGAQSRRTGPFADGADDQNASLAFLAYNTSKRSAVLDDSAEDRRTLRALIARAHILLSTTGPGQLDAVGLDYDELQDAFPELIILSITPFGLTGPWAGYKSSDLIGLAAGGILHTCGYDDHTIPPIRPGGNQSYQLAATFAYCGALLALIERQRTGRGQLVDVSMHDANAVSGELANPYWFYPRAIVQRQTCRHAQPVPTQPALFRCADDKYVYFALILADQHAWRALVAWMADHELAADLAQPEFGVFAHRQRNFAHIQELIEVFFLVQDSESAYHEGQRRGLPIGPLRAFEDLAADEHLIARDFFVSLDLGEGRATAFPGLPYRFSAFDASPRRAPRLGENTDEVLTGLERVPADGSDG